MNVTRRRRALASIAALMMAGITRAASEERKRRLGILVLGTRQHGDESIAPVLEALGKLGWGERKLAVEMRFADDDESRLRALAMELVKLQPDVLLCEGTAATSALRSATRSIPIVTNLADPVGMGFAASIGRPGGNVTGVSLGAPEAAPKTIEWIRHLAPQVDRLDVVLAADHDEVYRGISRPVVEAARSAGLAAEISNVRDIAGFHLAYPPRKGPVTRAIYTQWTPNFSEAQVPDIADTAIRARVALVTFERAWVKVGALMSFHLWTKDFFGRKAAILDKVLRGANPATTPFELPDRTDMVVNRTTAQALGLSISKEMELTASAIWETGRE